MNYELSLGHFQSTLNASSEASSKGKVVEIGFGANAGDVPPPKITGFVAYLSGPNFDKVS